MANVIKYCLTPFTTTLTGNWSIVLFLLLLITTYIYSQSVTEEWVRRYNGSDNLDDRAFAVALDTSGNIYVTGFTRTATQNDNFCTIKYNSSGVQQWVAIYNGPSNYRDAAIAITVDNSGNIYVTGESDGAGWLTEDFCTIKYNTDGVQQWIARWNGPTNGRDLVKDIAVDNNGYVYVTGHSEVAGYMTDDYITIKYDATNGDTVWVRRYDGPGHISDWANSLAIDNAGNVYVTGGSIDLSTSTDYCTIKYNSNGDTFWVRRYNGPGGNRIDIARKIVLDNLGNVYITGSSYQNIWNVDYATIKYNSAGVQQWINRYNGIDNLSDEVSSMIIDDFNNIIVTGSSNTFSSFTNYATIKYNTDGIQQWFKYYDGPVNNRDDVYDIAIDTIGNIYISGRSLGTLGDDFATIKYNTNGIQQWVMRYPGSPPQLLTKCMAVDRNFNVYVIGANNEAGTGIDFITIKYSQYVGVESYTNTIPVKSNLFQNYPNPFNAYTTIQFDLASSSYVSLIIYDILGKQINILINSLLKSGGYQIHFDGSNLSSGIYFYRLTIDGKNIGNKKMILSK